MTDTKLTPEEMAEKIRRLTFHWIARDDMNEQDWPTLEGRIAEVIHPELDRLRQSSGAGRELSEGEILKRLADVLKEDGYLESEAALMVYKLLAPHISSLLAEREALAVAGMIEAAARVVITHPGLNVFDPRWIELPTKIRALTSADVQAAQDAHDRAIRQRELNAAATYVRECAGMKPHPSLEDIAYMIEDNRWRTAGQALPDADEPSVIENPSEGARCSHPDKDNPNHVHTHACADEPRSAATGRQDEEAK